MDFQSELIWHLAALGRLATEAHDTAIAAGQNRRVYALDDITQAVIDIFADYELRQPASVIADAVEDYVRQKAAEGNSRAMLCLERYYPEQPVPDGSTLNTADVKLTDKA